MLYCWAATPEKRPSFKTLQQDLDDFEKTCCDKYKHYHKFLPDDRKSKEVQSKGEKDVVGHDKKKKRKIIKKKR